MFASYRKSGSLHLFSVTNLRPEVESMYLTAHAQTLFSQKSRKMVSHTQNDRFFTGNSCTEFKFDVRF